MPALVPSLRDATTDGQHVRTLLVIIVSCGLCVAEILIEFGTVLVFSCEASCWDFASNEVREEHVLVQSDPDSELMSSCVTSLNIEAEKNKS